jgi:hypothetical protein
VSLGASLPRSSDCCVDTQEKDLANTFNTSVKKRGFGENVTKLFVAVDISELVCYYQPLCTASTIIAQSLVETVLKATD